MADLVEAPTFQTPEDLAVYRRDLTASLLEFQRPQTYEEARQLMLSLPGMENYLALTEGQETQAVTLAVDDFLERTRALSEIGWTGYLIGMSDTEKRETFSQPGRTPYQTFLEEPMNRSGLLNQYLSVGSYLVHEYQDAA